MNNGTWPQHQASSVLYILDASNRLEQSLLQQWIQGNADAGLTRSEQVTVPIATSRVAIPTAALARCQDLPPETLVIPLRMVWLSSLDEKGSRPRLRDLLRGNLARPGQWRARRILKKQPSRVHRIAAEPATLEELQERMTVRHGNTNENFELFADFIAGQAGLALDVAERRLRGSRYKVPRQVARNLQTSPDFIREQALLAEQTGRPMEDVQAESGDILKELISTPNAFWIDVMGALTRKIRTLGYKSDMVIDRHGLERARQISREHPCVFLFTHKTHVDAFAHMSVLYENDFPAPHTLGGVNMAFAGLGYTLRHSGAIFIRRSFADNALYKMVLRQYIAYLMAKRFSLSWAFEGTRSRIGKLMPPRYGLLKYVIEACHGAKIRKLHIIPVAINYDLIGDVKDYATEQAGAAKRPESLSWFMAYLRGLKTPMGQIYLDYGEPVILDHAPSPDDRLALSKVAFQVGVEANKLAPVTLPSLITLILLGAAPAALTQAELLQQLDAFVDWIRERGIRLTDHFGASNRQQLIDIFRLTIDKGLISEYSDGPENLYAISPGQSAEASYYRNTTVHYFVNKAIAELALLQIANSNDHSLNAFWYEAERLRDLFKFEFFYAPTEEFRQQVAEEIERYHPDWESALTQKERFSESLLLMMSPHVAHSALLPIVEAYRVVSDVIARFEDSSTVEESDCIAQALSYGRQAYLQRRISSEASIGKQLFHNGYKLMANMGLVAGGQADTGVRRRQQSHNFRELAFRLDKIRTLAQAECSQYVPFPSRVI